MTTTESSADRMARPKHVAIITAETGANADRVIIPDELRKAKIPDIGINEVARLVVDRFPRVASPQVVFRPVGFLLPAEDRARREVSLEEWDHAAPSLRSSAAVVPEGITGRHAVEDSATVLSPEKAPGFRKAETEHAGAVTTETEGHDEDAEPVVPNSNHREFHIRCGTRFLCAFQGFANIVIRFPQTIVTGMIRVTSPFHVRRLP